MLLILPAKAPALEWLWKRVETAYLLSNWSRCQIIAEPQLARSLHVGGRSSYCSLYPSWDLQSCRAPSDAVFKDKSLNEQHAEEIEGTLELDEKVI